MKRVAITDGLRLIFQGIAHLNDAFPTAPSPSQWLTDRPAGRAIWVRRRKLQRSFAKTVE
jgi:hypothetical protein